MANIRSELHGLAASGDDLEGMLSIHIDVLIRHEGFYRRLVTEAAMLPAETRNTYIAIQSTVSIHFSRTLERGIGEGRFKDIPLHMMFNAWLGLVHYYLQNGELFAPGESVLTCRKDELVGSFMSLISK
jgi:hypothetical protein